MAKFVDLYLRPNRIIKLDKNSKTPKKLEK